MVHAGHDVTHAHLAAADLLTQVARLQRVWRRLAELLVTVDRRQPEAERRRVIVAGPSSVALDERRRPELFQARTGRVQRLSCAVSTCAGVLSDQTARHGFTCMQTLKAPHEEKHLKQRFRMDRDTISEE